MNLRILLALLVVALGLLVLRPSCDHAPAWKADCATGACGVTVDEGKPLEPVDLLTAPAPQLPLGVALFALAGLTLLAGSRGAARLRLPDLPARSFSARSARVLR